MALTDQVLMPGTDYQALCDALRARLGTSAPICSGSLGQLVQSIPSGAALPTLDHPGDAAKLLAGYQLIGQDGQAVTGTMPEAAQATPVITVDSGGKITASAAQAAGHVAAGTKTATRQLSVQPAKTWTPGTANQSIPSGRYLTGAQTIKGDSNLKAANIVKGVSIFGVAGTAEAGSGTALESCAVDFGINVGVYCTVYYETLNDGVAAVNIISDSNVPNEFTIENIPIGSTIMIYAPDNGGGSCTGLVAELGVSEDYAVLLYQANGDGGITVI